MIRLLCVSLIIFSTSAFAQDTLAVIDSRLGGDDADIFFSGDSMLVRIPGATSGWYLDKQKLGEVDLGAVRSALPGIRQYGILLKFDNN